jgi:hypothetical protein
MASRLPALRRWVALPAGIYLTGLPAYYAIATVGLTDKSAAQARHIGVILFAVWVAIAVYAGYLALSRDPRTAAPPPASPRRRATTRQRHARDPADAPRSR